MTRKTFTIQDIHAAFNILYNIMESENADPDRAVYAATSVETDLINILTGELLPDGSRKSSGRTITTMTGLDKVEAFLNDARLDAFSRQMREAEERAEYIYYGRR